jgi:single-strand DNA-binding protein
MAGDTVITVIGNLTADPELRFTPSGAAVANFTVASTPRHFNKESNQWEDGEALFLRCSIWRDAAENVAETLNRGDRVIVTGRLKQRSYETNEGQKRTVIELEVDEIGPSLKWKSATLNRTERTRGQQAPQGGDPWSTATPAQAPAWAQAPQQAQAPLPGAPQGQPPGYGYQGQPQPAAPGTWGTPPPGDEPPF